jgi:polyhydroxybutyrate depolymerase
MIFHAILPHEKKMLFIMSSQTTSLLWLTLLYLLPVTVVSTCGNPSTLKPGQRQWISLKVGSVTRSALVYAPSSSSVTDTAKALPLVLNFHGNPSDAEAQADYTEMDASAQRHGFYVVYPQGIDEAFNAGGCCADATADDVGFARALVKYMSDNACVDSKRVFATGWSNGGYMAYYLACLASDIFAAIAPVGGLIGIDPATECSPQFPPRVLAFHETGDPEVSYQGGGDEYLGAQALLAQFAKKQGCDPNNVQVSYQKGEVTCRSHTSCPAGKNATLCTIQRAFHSWPNACSECAGTVDANYVGTTNINGNEEIYQFFAASTIAPTVAPTSKSPTVLPTKAPTTKSPTYVPPTKASPTPSGTPKPPVLFCFPGESTVEVLHATRHSHNGTTSTAVVTTAMRNL